MKTTNEIKDQLITLYMEGLPYAEIAAKLGVPENGLGSRISMLRSKGYNLPYRKQDSPEQRPGADASLAASAIRLWK